MQPVHLRIFLSSPGDVAEERRVAREVIEGLPHHPLHKGKITTEVVAYDHPEASTPLDASRPPQESVLAYNTPPSACDLTIVLLWSRFGTPLPRTMQKPGGGSYGSGTEWEYQDAISAGKNVFVYARSEAPRTELSDPALEEKILQYKAVKQFVESLLRGARPEHQGAPVGVNSYKSPAELRGQLEQHLHTFVRSVLETKPADPGTPRPQGFQVFLAEAGDDMRAARMRLEADLKRLPGITVLPSVPPPLERAAHRAAAREVLRQATLAVHFLGLSTGPPIEDGPDFYAVEQARLGLEGDSPQLILQPPRFDRSTVTNPDYAQVLEALARRPDDRDRLEVVQASRTEMLEVVLEHRRRLQEGKRRRSNQPAAFVDLHARDARFTGELLQHLRARGIEPLVMDTPEGNGESPAVRAERFHSYLRRAGLFLVVYGEVAGDWVVQRLREATQLIVADEIPARVGVYVAPPHDEAKPDRVKRFPLAVVADCSRGFEPAPLDRLLALTLEAW